MLEGQPDHNHGYKSQDIDDTVDDSVVSHDVSPYMLKFTP